MDMQEFQFPKLFKEKSTAVTFLETGGLWVLHPGLFVSSMVDPKLKVLRYPVVYGYLNMIYVFIKVLFRLPPSKHRSTTGVFIME